MRPCRKFLGVLAVLGLAGLVGCASPAPAMRDERTAVISGRETEGAAPADAVQKALLLAAKMTVDHGFRYFRIVGSASPFSTGGDTSIRPGADVTIKVFHDGETSTRIAGIWDAQQILTTGVPNRAALSNAAAPAPSPSGSAARMHTQAPPPRCTAYGCDW